MISLGMPDPPALVDEMRDMLSRLSGVRQPEVIASMILALELEKSVESIQDLITALETIGGQQ